MIDQPTLMQVGIASVIGSQTENGAGSVLVLIVVEVVGSVVVLIVVEVVEVGEVTDEFVAGGEPSPNPGTRGISTSSSTSRQVKPMG